MSKGVEWGERHGEGSIVCECDQCGEQELIDFDDGPDFRAAQEELKEMGWISRKIDGEWYDFCSEACYYDWIKENK
jgi:hypothetical protein